MRPGDVRYSPVGVLPCCADICTVRYREQLVAYWCIGNGHEGSQSRLESSLLVIVGHFVSDLDLAYLRPGLGMILRSHSSISMSSVAPAACVVP